MVHGPRTPAAPPSHLSEGRDDLELLERCRGGDDTAWEDLYALCIPLVRCRAMRMGFSESEAGDICQEVLVTLAQNIRSVKNAKAYVQTVAFRRCVDLIRRRRREIPYEENPGHSENYAPPQSLLRVWLDQWQERTRSVERAEAGMLALEKVREGLIELKEPCHGLLKERFFQGRSYKELAHDQGIPGRQVGVQLSRCVEKLKKILQEDHATWSAVLDIWDAMR